MPTYQYQCNDCGRDLEVVQKFSDPALTVCPSCEGSLRKVFSAVGVVFKGSGFYSTDNHTKGASRAATGDSSSSASSESTPKSESTSSSPSSSTKASDSAS
ncbi:zinc ribbon domain-containing protein [Cutibacterium sp. WCA-380-WT-3A]|uniref:Zinc ribbon domain-containing protein n=1 Tax=Cutibacterium porci TaxID=2605781 RepID=A0A7K0J5E4_9ACTN|nr:FmdB family zinc ribbon protein [Cutibacterium porci]MSS45154.1 zinc ribbon domain-containing protein [Cutibacterium porci]